MKNRGLKKRIIGKTIIKVCKTCKKQFKVHNYRKDNAVFCSKKCWYRRNGEKIKKNCLNCNKAIIIHHYRMDAKYCSHKCHSESLKGKINFELQRARKKIRGEKHPMYGKHHTKETKKKISENHADTSGINSGSWKGGVTPIHERIRKSKEYILWRTAVFTKDNYSCAKCGEKDGKLNADHIKPFALYPELRFAIDNGQTLCKKCHTEKTSQDMILMRKETLIWIKN